MYLEEILNLLENEVAPKVFYSNSEPYGLQYGIKNCKGVINRIMITVDINIKSIQFALQNKINLVLSHHGLINNPIFYFSRNTIKKITMISKIPIYIFIMGIPFVAAMGGISDIIVDVLFLETNDTFNVSNSHSNEIPIGRICSSNSYLSKAKKLTVEDLILRIKRNLNMKNVTFIGDLNQSVNKILVIGHEITDLEYLEKIKEKGCDCCVCYRTNHVMADYALDENIALIELSHYQVELLALRRLLNILSLKYPNDEFFLYESEDPFKIF